MAAGRSPRPRRARARRASPDRRQSHGAGGASSTRRQGCSALLVSNVPAAEARFWPKSEAAMRAGTPGKACQRAADLAARRGSGFRRGGCRGTGYRALTTTGAVHPGLSTAVPGFDRPVARAPERRCERLLIAAVIVQAREASDERPRVPGRPPSPARGAGSRAAARRRVRGAGRRATRGERPRARQRSRRWAACSRSRRCRTRPRSPPRHATATASWMSCRRCRSA